MWPSKYIGLLILGLGLYTNSFAQVDTLFCGDTLMSAYDPALGGATTDSFFIWLGNCQPNVKFDFNTAAVPDGADIFYYKTDGTQEYAGSMPYFGGNCTGPSHFSDPTLPIQTALDPLYCLEGFVEIYGQGIPFHDSVKQRFNLPSDFKLPGLYTESARLHLNIPDDVMALIFVVKYNAASNTILTGLWDCNPTCCIEAIGDTICAGDSIFLDTDRLAFGYYWTGPNGFTSTLKSPVIPNATKAAEGWYQLDGSYMFGCTGTDAVFVKVNGPNISITPEIGQTCPGISIPLQAQGGTSYSWDTSAPGFVSASGATATVAPIDTAYYWVVGTDANGCSDTATAMVVPDGLFMNLTGKNPSCPSESDGSISAINLTGVAPYQIRLTGGTWKNGTTLENLIAGNHSIEVKDAAGCETRDTLSLFDPTPVTGNLIPTDPTCIGRCDGTAIFVPNGGQAPYTYFMTGFPADSIADELCTGTYTAKIRDANGCKWTGSVTLNDPPAFEAASFSEDPSCIGQCDGSVRITPVTGKAPFSYWVDGNTYNTGQIEGLCTGEHFLKVIDTGGCEWEGSVTLNDPEPFEGMIGTNDPSCLGSCDGEVMLMPLSGVGPYTFLVNDSETDSVATGFCEGNYSAEIIDAKGCEWETTFEIENPDLFEIKLGNDRAVMEGNDLTLKVKSKHEIDSVHWEGLCESACGTEYTFAPDSTMAIKVTAWSASGCVAKDSIWVTVKRKAKCHDGVLVPTAFTPNGDGHNDHFTVYADLVETDVRQVDRLLIYNKWGKVVFDKSNFSPNEELEGWDGYTRGQAVREGAYPWVGVFVREDGLKFKCSGSVLVIR